MLDGPWPGILASLMVALFFNHTLVDEISGHIALKSGGLKLLDAPMEQNKEESGYGPANMTLGRWDEPASFSIDFVAHILGKKLRLNVALSELTMRICRCQMHQLKFSRC